MQYVSPTTTDEAMRLLSAASGACRILAGGTDLLVQLRAGLAEPDMLVDIKRIAELREIARTDGGWRIGAAVSGAELGEHAALAAEWPGVVEAVNLIGSTQIQGRATMVGNLCNASPAADGVPALVAANAVARVIGAAGERAVPVLDIPSGPGKTTLKPDEFVASIFLPARVEGSADAYLRFIPRTEMDIAVVGCAVWLAVDADGQCSDARVALGAVGPKVLLVEEAAKALIGSRLDDAALDELASACSAAARPIADKRGTAEFRTRIAGVLARRAARIAMTRAGGKA